MAVHACTLAFPVLLPTNYEMVRMSPTILWARAISGTGTPINMRSDPEPDEPPFVEPLVTFEVLEVIKGSYERKTFTAMGNWKYYEGPSDPNSFGVARPGAGMGACVAYDYQLGTPYLLILPPWPHREDDTLGGYAFSRINEEAPEGSPWLDAVRRYVRIAALNDWRAERQALQATAEAIRAVSGATHPLVDDIRRHFLMPSPFKSFDELLAMLRRPSIPRIERRAVLYAMASQASPRARKVFERELAGKDWRENLLAIATYTERARDRSLGEALLKRLPAIKSDAGYVLAAVCASVDGRMTAPMVRLLQSTPVNSIGVIARWFLANPSAEGTAALKQRWQSDAADNLDVGQSLAGLGDLDVLAQAKARIAVQGPDAWEGIYLAVASSLPESDEVVASVSRDGKTDQVAALVDAFSGSPAARHWHELLQLAGRPAPPSKVQERLGYLLESLQQKQSPHTNALKEALASATR